MDDWKASDFIWTDGIETALLNIRDKALANSDQHACKYSEFKGYLKYFRVPVIVLAGLNSVFSVGLQPYVEQSIISVISCAISLSCGVIGSVELFIGIQTMMEKEIFSSKDFYILACDIYKTLAVERPHRTIDGIAYLDMMNTRYCNLIEQGNLIDNDKPEIGNKKFEKLITEADAKVDAKAKANVLEPLQHLFDQWQNRELKEKIVETIEVIKEEKEENTKIDIYEDVDIVDL